MQVINFIINSSINSSIPHADRDRPSDIANTLICAAVLIFLKQKQIKKLSIAFSQRIKEIVLEDRNY